MKMKGFTLIEMVVTLIIGSILVLGIAGFVELGARGYSDTVERQRLQTQAKFVLEKMSREVRHAVPNMLIEDRTNNCISFFPIIESGFYAISGADLQFIVGRTGVSVDDIKALNLVINPTEANPTNNIVPLTNVSSAADTFIVPNGASSLVGSSVSKRHYIYNSNGRVSYCLTSGQLRRGINGLNFLPLSDSGVSGTLGYVPASVQHNGIVEVGLTFSNTEGDESTSFRQEVQVLNVP